MRTISQLLATLMIIAIVIGAGIFLAWILTGTLSMFRQSTSITVTGGTLRIDPSSPRTVFGDVIVSIVGPDQVSISGITVDYRGTNYYAVCLNCGSVVHSNYPNSANDVVTLRFYFTANSAVNPGDKVIVTIIYSVQGETKYATGSLTVFSS